MPQLSNKHFFPDVPIKSRSVLVAAIAIVLLSIIGAKGRAAYTPKNPLLKKQLELCLSTSFQNDSFPAQVRKLQQMADALNDTTLQLYSRELIVFFHYQHGNIDSLRTSTISAQKVAKKLNNNQMYYSVWVYLLSNYNLSGLTEHAITGAKKMLEEAIADNYQIGIAHGYEVLGDIYLNLKNHNEALSYFEKAYRIFDNNSKDPFSQSSILYSSVVATIALEQYDKTLTLCDKIDSIANYMEEDYAPGLIKSFLLVGCCGRVIAYSKTNNLEQAEVWISSMDKYLQKDERQIDFYNEAKGIYYETTKQYYRAIKAYSDNEQYYSNMGLYKEMNRFIIATARVQQKAKLYAEACKNYNRYAVMQDSLYTTNSYRQANEFAVLSDMKMLEIRNKELEIAIVSEQKRVFSFWLSISLVTLLLISIFLITEHRLYRKLKISEVKLTYALKKAESLDKLKSSFLENISHEIRTPLNAIVGFSNILSETSNPQKIANINNIIEQNSDLLLHLMDDILNLSRIEAGYIEFAPRPFDLTKFINDLGLTFKQRATSKGIALICQTPYKACIVELDPLKMNQIVSNLITNAIKFTSQGSIELGYYCNKHEVAIFVKDTGKGIEKKDIDIIFDRFIKIDEFTQGTGLGLPICKAIIDALNGSITVSSEIGKGSTFTIRIPCSPQFDLLA